MPVYRRACSGSPHAPQVLLHLLLRASPQASHFFLSLASAAASSSSAQTAPALGFGRLRERHHATSCHAYRAGAGASSPVAAASADEVAVGAAAAAGGVWWEEGEELTPAPSGGLSSAGGFTSASFSSESLSMKAETFGACEKGGYDLRAIPIPLVHQRLGLGVGLAVAYARVPVQSFQKSAHFSTATSL